MRLAIGEPTANRRPDTRRVLWIDGVHVEAQVQERTAAACSSASRMHGSTPRLSRSLIVNTFASSRFSRSRSPWSSDRTPTSASFPGSIAGSVQSS